jgi:flagellar biosynthesis protein FlhB
MRALVAAARGRVAQADVAALAAYALVPAVAAALAGIASGLVQSGGLRVVPVVPKFERLNPVESLKRMLSRETTTHAARAAVAFAIAVAAVVPSMRDLFATMGESAAPQRVAALAWMGAQHVAFGAGAVGTVFAFAEYGVARRAWLQKLKMSFDELKRDIKESDGDPSTRSRRKALHRALLRGAVAKVKDASFVVVNPTHVAIALQYRPPEIAVPTVLVRAADDAALAVRKLALEHRVPVIENVALARALYRDAHVGDPIPHAHYVAVAEIVAALSRGGVLS